MKYLLLIAFMLTSFKVSADNFIVPCIQTVTPNGGISCVPVSTTNPIPTIAR